MNVLPSVYGNTILGKIENRELDQTIFSRITFFSKNSTIITFINFSTVCDQKAKYFHFLPKQMQQKMEAHPLSYLSF